MALSKKYHSEYDKNISMNIFLNKSINLPTDILTNVYINLYDISYDHHPDVIKKIEYVKNNKKYFDVKYDDILLDLISSYNGIPITNIMIINNFSSFINILLKKFNKKTIRILNNKPSNLPKNIHAVSESRFFSNITEDVIVIENPIYITGNLFDTVKIQNLLLKYMSSIFIIDESYMDYLLLNDKLSYTSAKLYYFPNLFIIRSFHCFKINTPIHYVISSVQNIKKMYTIYNYYHILDISKIYVIEILKNIKYYRNNINKIDNFKNYLIHVFNNNRIPFQLNDSNVFYIRTFEFKELTNILKKNNIQIYNLYKINYDDSIKIKININ